MRRTPRGEAALVAALAVLPLLPFLGAAVSIDAPVFLAVSRQILAHPGDPYGFDMLWDPTSPHVAAFNQNPPLLSYYLAPWVAVFGEWEPALHAALLPFPLVAALAFLGIARRWTGQGLAATALLLCTPAFLVLATSLMLDVPALAGMLCAVYALLRAREGGGARWELAAGAAAALAGLTKYVAMASAPLLAAGVVLLLPRRAGPLLRAVGLPLALWAAWFFYTAVRYGQPHFLGAADVVADRSFAPRELWNHVLSVPVYYGAALVFPMLAWLRAIARRTLVELGVVGLVAGGAVAVLVLPDGTPARRDPLALEEAVLAVLAFAGATLVWGACLRPRRVLAAAEDRFLAVWLGGFLLFSLAVNWHVNAADALLAAPPALLMSLRQPDLRPPPRTAALWVGVMLPLSLLLARAEAVQADAYRETARLVAAEIGDRPGARWFVGNWGLQYYLEREGFRALPPPHIARPVLDRDDWVVAARNLTQMAVGANLQGVRMREVWSWSPQSALPLRTNNPDAGAGFYSHHVGYVPWAIGRQQIERVSLGRVTSGTPRRGPTAAPR